MITVNGQQAIDAEIHVQRVGPWFIDLDMADDAALTNPIKIEIQSTDGAAATVLQGTIAPEAEGSFGLQRHVRIIGGKGGWRKLLKAKQYQNDGGVTAASVASDAAREAGESLAEFTPAAARLGLHYIRQAGEAAAALEAAAGGQPWWVAFDGTTHVAPRSSVAADAARYQVLKADMRCRVATLAIDDLTTVGVGSVINIGTDSAGAALTATVTAFSVKIDARSMRMTAWIGDGERDRLADNLLGVIAAARRHRISGKWRYRVLGMAGDRVSCQAVRRDAGLPDIVNVAMWPGVAGTHAELSQGSEVLIEFIEEDPQQPVISAFGGRGTPAFVATAVHLADGDAPVARIGDTVNFFFPPTMSVTGTVSGNPFVGVITIVSPGVGVIGTGNPKVRA